MTTVNNMRYKLRQ